MGASAGSACWLLLLLLWLTQPMWRPAILSASRAACAGEAGRASAGSLGHAPLILILTPILILILILTLILILILLITHPPWYVTSPPLGASKMSTPALDSSCTAWQ